MLVHSEFQGFSREVAKKDEKFLNYSVEMTEIQQRKVFVTERIV
jgi:hypothetical protein